MPARPHAERLPGDILRSLARTGAILADVDVFAVAAGPGPSPGCASASPRSRAWRSRPGRPVVGVSALEALALAAAGAHERGSPAGAWASGWTPQREEVFAALYDSAAPGPEPVLTASRARRSVRPRTPRARWLACSRQAGARRRRRRVPLRQRAGGRGRAPVPRHRSASAGASHRAARLAAGAGGRRPGSRTRSGRSTCGGPTPNWPAIGGGTRP